MKSLKKHGHSVGAIHGDLDQRYRMEVLAGFKNNDITLLVASDVAARGLDIPAVSHVFNFDVPIHAEDYVHRIGRTGRAGRKGWAFMLCLPHEIKHLDKIEELVKQPVPRLEMDSFTTSKPERNVHPKKKRVPNRPKIVTEVQNVEPIAKAEVLVETTVKNGIPSENTTKKEVSVEPNTKHKTQRKSNPKEQDNKVKGLGDHIPAFLMR